MAGISRSAWVTTAFDKTEALEALVLAQSLTRVATTAETIVVVSSDFDDFIINKLAESFDVVIPFSSKGQLLTTLDESDLALLYSWNFTMYDKCAFLKPNSLVLKNCDELFLMDDIFAAARENLNDQLDTSIIVYKPSTKTFRKISSIGLLNSSKNVTSLLNLTFNGEEKLWKNTLSKDYNRRFPFSRNPDEENLDTAKIVFFATKKHLMDLLDSETDDVQGQYTNCPVANIIEQFWIAIFNNTIRPNLDEDAVNAFGLKKCILCSPINLQRLGLIEDPPKDAIAIIGHSCRLPGANNSQEFWDLLVNGGNGISKVPVGRLFDFQQSDPRFTESMAGFLKCPVDEFDAKFFGISPREAAFMDPQQRLLVEVAWEALENAAIDPYSLKGSNTAVFSGVWTHDYERIINETASSSDFHHVVLGNAFSATSARVSFLLGLNGPNVATESGCSSSMVALHLACDSLRKRETDLALVLGANILIIHFPLNEIPILAKDGRCKTFDIKADGFGRAEGVVVMALKRLSDALKNGDRVMGVIRGSALSNEGTSSSFGTPSKYCQEIAVKEALKTSQVSPSDVDYVEAHGTGTPVGDPIEFAAISSGYSSESKRDTPLLIGSVKSNIGHTESAAGLAGLLKVLLSMKNEIIPRNINFETLNPNICLDTLPARIPVENHDWPKTDNRLRRAGISSFGISGTNVHVIVEEPPQQFDTFICNTLEEKSFHILTLSAKSENALVDLSNKYIKYFDANPTVNINDLVFTANTGRAHLKHRTCVTGSNVQELALELQNKNSNYSKILGSKPKVAFLYTGHGSAYAGMAKELYSSNRVFRNAFNQCIEILRNNFELSLADVLWNDKYSSHNMDLIIYSHTAIFSVAYSLTMMWKSFGVEPDMISGHSAGESAAATAAGVFTLEEGLSIVVGLASLIHKYLPDGAMLAIRTSEEKVKMAIEKFQEGKNVEEEWLDISLINSPNQIIVSGPRETIILFDTYCQQESIKCQLLPGKYAFHSRAMEVITEQYREITLKINYKSPKCAYVSGRMGNIVGPHEINSDYLVENMRYAVQYPVAARTMVDYGCNIFIEMGATPILLALVMSSTNSNGNTNTLWLPSIRKNENNWKTLGDSVGKLYSNNCDIKWSAWDVPLGRKKLELPTYPFQKQKYWLDFKTRQSSSLVHPLLGSKIPLANIQESIYEHTWNLRDLPYLQDHQVANVITLPAAGYLEIIVAAGRHALLEKANRDANDNYSIGATVEDFVVESPLELAPDKNLKVQVVVSPVDVDGKAAKVFVSFFVFQNLNGYNDEKGWRKYASGTMGLDDKDISENKTENIIENLKKRCPAICSTEELYQTVADLGICFGKSFQSISSVWKGDNEVLAEIPVPSGSSIGNTRDYIFHPIVLDAVIQTFGMSICQEKAALYLPVSVGKFELMETTVAQSQSEIYYAHATWDSGNNVSGAVKLYNEKNILLAEMRGLRLVKTSISSFLNVIASQKNMLPGLYQEAWRSRDGHRQSRTNLNSIQNPGTISNDSDLEKHAKNYRDITEIRSLTDKLISLEILDIFSKIVVDSKPGVIYSASSLSNYIKPGPHIHPKMLTRFLEILCEDGYLQVANGLLKGEYHLAKVFPFPEEILLERTKLYARIHDIETKIEMKDTISTESLKCLKNFGDILCQGQDSKYVDRPDKDQIITEVFTNGGEFTVANLRISKYLQTTFTQLKSGGEQSGSMVRILEIGAGTGNRAKCILHGLQESGIPFRYTFTDKNASVLKEAQDTFKDVSNVEYRLLDINNDPIRQGFVPFYYDVVIFGNVMYNTRDLDISTKHAATLVALNGFIMLQELSGPQRAYDMILGYCDNEFWEFNDSKLKDGHPVINTSKREIILKTYKFSSPVVISGKDEGVQVLISRAIENVGIEKSLDDKRRGWVLIGDDKNIINSLSKQLDSIGKHVHILEDSQEREKGENNYAYQIHNVNLSDSDAINTLLDSIFENFIIDGVCYIGILNDNENQERICLPLLVTAQNVMRHSRIETGVYCVIRGAYLIGDQNIVNPSAATLIGIQKTLCLEFPESMCKIIDLDPESRDAEGDSLEIFAELISGEDLITAFRNKKKFVNRLTLLPKPVAPISLPQGRYAIALPSSKQINDVSFRPVGKASLGANDIEVEVKAVALNFRDVFVIMKPEQYHTLFEAVGTDFSGIISEIGANVTKYKVGDKIFGMSNTSSAASHVVIHENMALRKPMSFTYADACTLPSVLLTAVYCLYNVGDLKKGETILIHVASGGVGLVAIQLAKMIGANIIATAGSKRKRNYLNSIGIQNVFHSRDLSFGEDVMRVTDGKGVDMVLNSLTGVGFKETSLKVCSSNARFVEMGKVNIWKEDEVEILRPDVKYTIVDVEKTNEQEMSKLLEDMTNLIEKGHISPLPYCRFDISQIKEAFNYFLKSQHIGKVVLSMSQMRETNGSKFTKELIFNDFCTYLVTGGLGGIGLEVAKWMGDSGARNIVVVGRNPPDQKAQEILNSLRNSGCNITSMQVDIGNWDECKKLFDYIQKELPALKGVIHSAGALSDGVLTRQNWSKFQTVFNAKVNGGWNLHNLTKDMNLEHFVLFSSIAGLLGNLGQSNHSSANLFLDSLASHRYSLGLPAQSIQWGAWSSVGAATNTTFGREGALGFKPFSPTQGISALKFIVSRPNLTQVAVVQMNVKVMRQHFRDKGNGLSELDNETEEISFTEQSTAASDAFWAEINSLNVEQRVLYIKKSLEKIIHRTLKLPETEPLDEHQPFSEMGLDSLMAVEMKNKLQNIVGKSLVISTNSLLDYPTINGLCRFLAQETMKVRVRVVSRNNSNSEESEMELIKRDSILPDDIRCITGAVHKIKGSDMQNILVTGSTGYLGAYVVKELLDNTNLKIHCLIRGKDGLNAKKKLAGSLKKYNLESDLNRVLFVVGNITEENLGLPKETYDLLSSDIDMVFHFAVKANHIEKYRETKSKSDIRSVNVLGTLNVLRFASNIKTKAVLYSSSYTTANRLTEDGLLVEDFPEEENYGEELKMGYVVSKFICEKLFKAANDRGIPCTVIRYPTLGGHSETGFFVPGSSTFINILLLTLRLGVISDVERAWYSISVDLAAKLTLRLAFNENLVGGLYHINLSDRISTTDFIEVSKECGYPIQRVNDEEYKNRFLKESEKNATLKYFLESYGTDLISIISDANPILTRAFQSRNNIYKLNPKLVNEIPEIQESVQSVNGILGKYFAYMEHSGMVQKLS